MARVVQGPGQMCGKGGSMKSPVRNESRIAQNVRKGTQEGAWLDSLYVYEEYFLLNKLKQTL